jgi:hypothetical protein
MRATSRIFAVSRSRRSVSSASVAVLQEGTGCGLHGGEGRAEVVARSGEERGSAAVDVRDHAGLRGAERRLLRLSLGALRLREQRGDHQGDPHEGAERDRVVPLPDAEDPLRWNEEVAERRRREHGREQAREPSLERGAEHRRHEEQGCGRRIPVDEEHERRDDPHQGDREEDLERSDGAAHPDSLAPTKVLQETPLRADGGVG